MTTSFPFTALEPLRLLEQALSEPESIRLRLSLWGCLSICLLNDVQQPHLRLCTLRTIIRSDVQARQLFFRDETAAGALWVRDGLKFF